MKCACKMINIEKVCFPNYYEFIIYVFKKKKLI